jgi:hypothetical protein
MDGLLGYLWSEHLSCRLEREPTCSLELEGLISHFPVCSKGRWSSGVMATTGNICWLALLYTALVIPRNILLSSCPGRLGRHHILNHLLLAGVSSLLSYLGWWRCRTYVTRGVFTRLNSTVLPILKNLDLEKPADSLSAASHTPGAPRIDHLQSFSSPQSVEEIHPHQQLFTAETA